jgi:hypothetical protein
MRRFLSFLMASAILLAGLALAAAEVTTLLACRRGVDDWRSERVAG